MIYGFIAWLVTFVLAPVDLTLDLTWQPLMFIASGYLALLLGMQAIPQKASMSVIVMDRRLLKVLLISATVIGSVGMMLKQYDLYSIRGADIAQNVVLEGKDIARAGTNSVAAVAAVFYPCCYLVLFLYLAYTEGGRRGWRSHAVAILVTLAPGINGILLGSRSRLLIGASLALMYYVYFGIVRLNFKAIALGAVASICLSTIFSLVFISRLDSMRIDPTFSVYQSGYAFTVRPDAWADGALAANGISYYVAFSSLMLTQYAVHGIFEFVYLYQHFQGPHMWGAYTFGVYFKAITMLFGGQDMNEHVMSVLPRSGVFTSFFGSTYVDFGWFSIPYLVFMGMWVKVLWNRALQRDYSAAPLYLYFAVILFFMPLTNFIFGAEGLYAITTMLLYWAIAAFGRREARR